MIKKAIFISAFNHQKYTDERLTEPWINKRLDIFEDTALRGLKAQTNQDFEAYFQCDPLSMDIINVSLAKREPLPSNVHFNTHYNNRMHSYEFIKGSDVTYEIRLDSDNLYEKNYVDRIYHYEAKPETQAIISQNGHIYDINTHELAVYFRPSPPFYTLIYSTKEYIAGKRHKIGGHPNVINQCKYELLEGYNYLVTLHNTNVVCSEKLLREHEAIEGEQKQIILSKYGMS